MSCGSTLWCDARGNLAGRDAKIESVLNELVAAVMRRFIKWFIIVCVLIAGLTVAGYVWHRHRFPYGYSHCCDKMLWSELLRYAEVHSGWFPQGEASPEASLSLLYRQDPMNDYLLRGKIVPLEVVRPILERGELLTPETCGWHYVEGLRMDDDHRIALFWDKAGLGHNGQRLNGWRDVTLINGMNDSIKDSEWDDFLAEQETLVAEAKKRR